MREKVERMEARRVDTAESSQRYMAPDVLRGMAILLLALTNVPLILTTIRYRQVSGLSPFVGTFWEDVAVTVFLAIPAVTGMGMFVLAMGQGLSRAGDDERAGRAALVRLVVIGGVGFIHGFVIWWGDILFYYMIAGMIALYFRARLPRTQIVAGLCILLLPLVLTISDLLSQFGGVDRDLRSSIEQSLAGYRRLQAGAESNYVSGDFGAIITQRAADWFSYFQDFALIGVPQLVGILLVGIGIARDRDAVRSWFERAQFRMVFSVVASAAVISYLFQIAVLVLAPEDIGALGSIAASCQIFAAPMIAVCAYLLLIRYEDRLARSRAARAMAATGSYSLSIYLFTSIVFSVFAYQFGAFGRIPFAQAELLSILVFFIFVILANLAHKSDISGPFEWLLRKLSYRSAPKTPHVVAKEMRYDVGNS